MQKHCFFLITVALLVSATVPAEAQRRSREKAEQEIRQIEQDSVTATMAMDWKFFDRILAPDWTAIDPLGRQLDKAGLLREFRQMQSKGTTPRLSTQLYDVSVRFLNDDVALLTCRFKISGPDRNFMTRASEIYVWREGRWMVAATHTTLVKGT